jgi:23S rRNA (cytosine1962-C5)-methyltransferase
MHVAKGVMSVAILLHRASLSHSSACAHPLQSYRRIVSMTANSGHYEFLDCGSSRRLELFGDKLVVRSCPAATNKRAVVCDALWSKAKLNYDGTSGKTGTWNGNAEADWVVNFGPRQIFNLLPSAMGQVGVFPEQYDNWEWIKTILREYKQVHSTDISDTSRLIKVLNGFAYTGGSTLAAHEPGGVQVTHLDAAKSFNLWAARNINSSYSNENAAVNIKYITEDCMTYVNREIKRQNKYDVLIFDPPAFGRFDGKMWKLEDDLEGLVEKLPQLLSDKPCAVVLSCHDVDWPAARLGELLSSKMRHMGGKVEAGELVLARNKNSLLSASPNKLTMGCFARWRS